MLSAALATKVLALILSLPTCYRETAQPDRLAVVAESISEVSDTPAEAAALVTIAYHESVFCESVHAGKRKGGPGEGLWQIEPGSHRPRPYSGTSKAETKHAAGEALWLWRHTAGCATISKRFGAYAGLGCRTWPGATKRERFYWWARSVLLSGYSGTPAAPTPPRNAKP